MIGIVDYGAGNLGSVMNALGRLGEKARFVRGPDELVSGKTPFEKIIFPGDGHFGTAMASLNKTGFAEALRAWIAADKPFLGICIGMQLLFESSEEAAGVPGLGVVEGAVRKFPCRKIPQIGWNTTYPVPGSPLFAGLPPEYFYYIHSFYCAPRRAEDAAATARYYLPYCAAVQRGALAAVQFHPEKSGEAGLSLLRRWLDQATTPPAKSGGSGTDRSRFSGGGCGAGGSSVGARLDFSSTLPSGLGGAPPHDADSTGNSLTKRIIPCLDVDDGRVVKGVRFAGLADAGCPEELARRYNDGGADELTFLDIGASYKSRLTLLDIVGKVAAKTFVPLCVGGGIRTVDDMRDAMNAGADKVSVCSAALKRPALLSEMAAAYGSQCVVLSIDAKRVHADGGLPRWNAFSRGGRDDTGIDAVSWAIEAVGLGAGEILLNSIDADGTGAGYDLALIRAVTAAVPVPGSPLFAGLPPEYFYYIHSFYCAPRRAE
ncbi:MAG: imidazole glycerol phosphate synthase subunit HisH, partial [Spirochaetaceae bacterium]|nr:imidazole glycerol phosphate synthase subunit HisH [Spirochaetaceae bacterium]